MFAYNPGVYDQSGQILADSTTRAAAINAQMLNDLGKNVGSGMKKAASAAVGFATGGPAGAAMAMKGANEEGGGGFLDTIVNSYAKKEQDKSDAKIYGSLMKVIAPAFGKDGNSILETFNSFENDAEKAEYGRTIAGSLGVIGNMYAQTRSAGIQQQGQQLATDRMYTQEQLRREREIMKQPPASNSVFTGGSLLRGLFQPMPTTTKPGP